MTHINDPNNLGADLFGYKIKYNQVEGLQTPDTSDTALQVLPRYNGNIAEVDWRIGNENDPLKRYGYVYDGLNRLSAGFYQDETNPSLREYYEKVTYDLNGNIKTMKRTAHRFGTTAMLIDNLSYQYENNNKSNRLQKITDAVTTAYGYPYKATPTDIGYDLNGNMTSFVDKGISSIQYNYLNLPKQITQNGQVTNYTYRADGVKVKKLFGTLETNYLDGFQYRYWVDPYGNVANNGMKLSVIPTSEGFYDALRARYYYNYTDHLGNVRLNYSDSDGDGIVKGDGIKNCDNSPPDQPCMPGIIMGDIEEVTDYYPFGMMHMNMMFYSFNNAYQYKYNGKELQETGMYDYGARFYMPDIGRWGVVDPLAEKYTRMSPYTYVGNNPAIFVDYDGRDYGVYVDLKAGTITIKATYYAVKGDMKSANGAIQLWNDKSGKYNYSYKDANGNKISLKINFQLKTSEVTPEKGQTVKQVVESSVWNDSSGEGNSYRTAPDDSFNEGIKGVAGLSKYVRVKDSESDPSTGTGGHEVGHTLGVSHKYEDIMGNSDSTEVTSNHVKEILDAIGGSPDNPNNSNSTQPKATIHIRNNNLKTDQDYEKFRNGKVKAAN
ncbi:RHS repeat-associated core domain-containing protein [Chryseobacterium aahli]|uniref:RHS repeat domain-containing protein n=1 Tax=Chryseobacterium aahli TaxID=1278643 RepID=UPI001F616E5E|nr:RHS repeat-associated core domain-containing protein [Chryseobacterium aahli]MCI3938906.1 RHS repeat-associated core domain-containing protein [Chryseobacterium aahli]